MIKICVNKAHVECRAIEGNLSDITAETLIAIKGIHNAIKDADKDAGKTFAELINKAFNDGIVFDDKKLMEVGEEFGKKKKSQKEELKEALKELKDLLDGICEDES